MKAFFMKIVSWYNDKLLKYPIRAAACTTPCIYGFGDYLA